MSFFSSSAPGVIVLLLVIIGPVIVLLRPSRHTHTAMPIGRVQCAPTSQPGCRHALQQPANAALESHLLCHDPPPCLPTGTPPPSRSASGRESRSRREPRCLSSSQHLRARSLVCHICRDSSSSVSANVHCPSSCHSWFFLASSFLACQLPSSPSWPSSGHRGPLPSAPPSWPSSLSQPWLSSLSWPCWPTWSSAFIAFLALMAPAGFFIFSPMQPALANQSAKSIQKPGMIAWLSRASYPTRSPDSANTSQVSSEVHDGPRKELGLGFKCAALDFVDWGWGHLALWLWVGLVGHVFTVWLRTVPHSHARQMSARQDQGEAPTPQNPKPTKTEPAIAAALHPRRTSCRPPSPASEANVLDAT